MSDGFERTPYPANGNGKRKRGRPRGSKAQKGAGRPRGVVGLKTALSQDVIATCKGVVEDQAKWLTQRILQEESRIAFSDIRLIPGCPQNIPDEIAFAIQSFEVDERVIKSLSEDSDQVLVSRRTKFTLWPKGPALERLSRQMGLYEADNRQKPETRPQVNIYLAQGDVNMPPGLPGPTTNGYQDD